MPANDQVANAEDGWVRARLISASGIRGQQEQEARATAALLSVMHGVPEFGSAVLRLAGGPRSVRRIDTFAEIRLRSAAGDSLRPDGAAVVRVPGSGRRSWLIEVKTGNNALDAAQVEAYLDLAKEGGFDAVLTISNQITSSPDECPVDLPKRPGRQAAKRPDLYHLSWWRVLTEACVQHQHRGVSDPDQAWILSELIEYLDDERSGVVPFRDMGSGWAKVREAARQGQLKPHDDGVADVIARWEQLVEYLCLSLFRELGRSVEAVVGKEAPDARRAAAVHALVDEGRLAATIRIADAAAPILLEADLRSRVLRTGVELGAPKDRQQVRAAVTWLTRQLRNVDAADRVHVDALYPRGKAAGASLAVARESVEALFHPDDRSRMPRAFRITVAGEMGRQRGTRQGDGGFIESTRLYVADFYRDIVQGLTPWRPSAPKLRPEQPDEEPAPAERVVVPSAADE